MSKPMQILLGAFGLLLVAAIVLTMFGKPPNLPLGPLQGMLAGDEEVTADAGFDPNAGFGVTDCPPGDESAAQPGSADPTAADPTTADPAAGADPAAADPAGGGDPAAAADAAAAGEAPVASGSAGWDGESRVVAAGDDAYDPGRIREPRIVAAEATDPNAGAGGAPADPAAQDPGVPADPGAGVDADPLADGGIVDPCADPGAVGPGGGDGTGAAPGANGAGAGAGTGAAPGAAGANARQTTDGTNAGNSPEALRLAKDATSVMQEADIQVSTTATLVPSAGGVNRGAALRRYRDTVTGAVLVLKLDAAAQQQWTGAGKKVQADLIRSFLSRLGKTYGKATRSVSVVDESGNVLAIGDATPGSRGTVRLL